MRNVFKFGVYALLGVSLMFGATSCKDDDPDYENDKMIACDSLLYKFLLRIN